MAATSDDLARLLVQIELSQAKTEKQAAAIARAAERAAKKIDGDFKSANDNVGRSFDKAAKSAATSTGQARAAVTNLSFQLNDIAMGLASGTSPFTIMVQQGSQVAQALQGAGGGLVGAVRTLGGAFATMVNPVSLASFAIIGLTGAAVQYFMNLGSDASDAENVLKNHADLIRRIKDAYGEAAIGAETYSGVSRQLIEYDTRQTVEQYKATLTESAQELDRAIRSVPASTFQGATFTIQEIESAVSDLNQSVSAGSPNITGFLNRLIEIEQQEGTPEQVRALIQEIIESGRVAGEVQGKLAQLTSFINGVGDAAFAQSGRVGKFGEAISRLANIALPALTEMEQAVKEYNSAIASATNATEIAMAQDAFAKARERINTASIPIPQFRTPDDVPDSSAGGSRSTKISEAEREAAAVRELIETLEFERALVGATATEREVETMLRRAGAAATDEQIKKIRELVTETNAERDAIKQQEEAYRTLQGAGQTALNGLKTALADGKLEGQELLSILMQVAQQLLSMPSFGGGGGIGGFLGGVLSLVAHNGAVVGQGGQSRRVSPMTFAGAPRMHSGGGVGLRPDEVPAILQRGEVVIPKGAVAAAKSSSSRSQNQNVHVTVGVSADSNGNLMPFVESVSRRQAERTTKSGLAAYDQGKQRQQLTRG